MKVDLRVNGVLHAVDVEPRTTLLDVLRDASPLPWLLTAGSRMAL